MRYREILEISHAKPKTIKWKSGHNGSHRYFASTDNRYTIAEYRNSASLAIRSDNGLSQTYEFRTVAAAKRAAQDHAGGQAIITDIKSPTQLSPPPSIQPAYMTELQRAIGNALDATGFRRAREPEWNNEMISSPDGYIFDTQQGGVFLDAEVVREAPNMLGRMRPVNEIWLSEISVEQRGSGLGSAVMQAIHHYALTHKLGVRVFKVTNHKFFSRFNWLIRDGDSYYFYPHHKIDVRASGQSLAEASPTDEDEDDGWNEVRQNGFTPDDDWFHGTSRPIERFDASLLGSTTNARNTVLGFFFTSDEYHASYYAGKRGHVIDAVLRMRNPLRLKIPSNHAAEFNDVGHFLDEYVRNEYSLPHYPTEEDFCEWKAFLVRNGYDSIMVDLLDGHRVAIVFNANQIRDREAAFDPTKFDSDELHD